MNGCHVLEIVDEGLDFVCFEWTFLDDLAVETEVQVIADAAAVRFDLTF